MPLMIIVVTINPPPGKQMSDFVADARAALDDLDLAESIRAYAALAIDSRVALNGHTVSVEVK